MQLLSNRVIRKERVADLVRGKSREPAPSREARSRRRGVKAEGFPGRREVE